ncbi:MAG: hypothetical protein JWQ19_1799 [Subtercola sp.]|nr:hypothetical protein [Subtercola sp.]
MPLRWPAFPLRGNRTQHPRAPDTQGRHRGPDEPADGSAVLQIAGERPSGLNHERSESAFVGALDMHHHTERGWR